MSLDLYEFTDAQRKYAIEALLKLMKQRRFFLRERTAKRGYTIPGLFDSLRQVDAKLRQAYEQARIVAEGYIQHAESELGYAVPDLSDGQAVVHCNRYGGGLELCTAWPLARFVKHVPATFEEVQEVVATRIDTGSPSCTRFGSIAQNVWEELQRLDVQTSDQRVVALLKTRYHADCRFGNEQDLLNGKVLDFQQYPHALGYLLYQATYESHLLDKVRDFWILCSTSRESHVALSHPACDPKPRIMFDASGPYPYKIHFAMVL